MELYPGYKLTSKYQHSKRVRGKTRSYISYFLNGVQILKQKVPFDSRYDNGHAERTAIHNEYILNNSLYQTRTVWNGCNSKQPTKSRNVRFPLSRRVLKQFNIPKNLKITICSSI